MPQDMITTTTVSEKCCLDCKTTKTPLWRSGPSGPKVRKFFTFLVNFCGFLVLENGLILVLGFLLQSLCNACGIRHRKRRAATALAAAPTSATASSTLGLNREGEKIRKDGETTKKIKKRANVRNGKSDKLSMEWRQRLMAFGEGFVLFQKQRSQLKKRQRIHEKLGEVEQAAVLLMSLSCGSVFA